jgi:hypothetical protein
MLRYYFIRTRKWITFKSIHSIDFGLFIMAIVPTLMVIFLSFLIRNREWDTYGIHLQTDVLLFQACYHVVVQILAEVGNYIPHLNSPRSIFSMTLSVQFSSYVHHTENTFWVITSYSGEGFSFGFVWNTFTNRCFVISSMLPCRSPNFSGSW